MLTKLTPIETASEIIYQRHIIQKLRREMTYTCLLYTSDAADD